MTRFRLLAGAVLLGALAALPAAEAGERGGKVYKTPQEAFAALRAAAKKEDVRGMTQTLTRDTVDKMTGGLVFAALFIKGLTEAFGKDDKTGKSKEVVESIDKLLAKHGLTKEKVDALEKQKDQSGKKGDPKEMEAAMLKLAGLIKDRPGFLEDFMKVVKKMPGKQEGSPFSELAGAELKDLKVEGNTATGTVVSMKGGKEKRDPVRFKKEGDGWKIELDLQPKGGPGVAPPVPPAPQGSRLEARPAVAGRPAEPARTARR